MTIEAKLDETNNLLAQLLAAVSAAGIATVAQPQVQAPSAETKAAKPAAPAEPPKGEEKKPAALDYVKDITPLVLKFSAAKGRDATIEMLQRFGVTSARNLKPEQYPDVVAYLDEALK